MGGRDHHRHEEKFDAFDDKVPHGRTADVPKIGKLLVAL
jgi:hypothetical protein